MPIATLASTADNVKRIALNDGRDTCPEAKVRIAKADLVPPATNLLERYRAGHRRSDWPVLDPESNRN